MAQPDCEKTSKHSIMVFRFSSTLLTDTLTILSSTPLTEMFNWESCTEYSNEDWSDLRTGSGLRASRAILACSIDPKGILTCTDTGNGMDWWDGMVIFPYRDCQLSTLPSAEGGGGGGEWQFLSPLWNSGKFMLVPAGKRETEKVLDFFFFFLGGL